LQKIQIRNIGHYDYFLLDELQLVTERIFGYPLKSWWTNTLSIQMAVKEILGVIPFTKPTEWELVQDSDISHMPADLRFVAMRQNSIVLSVSFLIV
jgi:hypothetical protein